MVLSLIHIANSKLDWSIDSEIQIWRLESRLLTVDFVGRSHDLTIGLQCIKSTIH